MFERTVSCFVDLFLQGFGSLSESTSWWEIVEAHLAFYWVCWKHRCIEHKGWTEISTKCHIILSHKKCFHVNPHRSHFLGRCAFRNLQILSMKFFEHFKSQSFFRIRINGSLSDQCAFFYSSYHLYSLFLLHQQTIKLMIRKPIWMRYVFIKLQLIIMPLFLLDGNDSTLGLSGRELWCSNRRWIYSWSIPNSLRTTFREKSSIFFRQLSNDLSMPDSSCNRPPIVFAHGFGGGSTMFMTNPPESSPGNFRHKFIV